jgi:hypothetical protein
MASTISQPHSRSRALTTIRLAGEQRQRLLALLEHRHHLGHHVGHQADDDQQRHAGDDGRVEQGLQGLGAQGVAAVQVVGQLGQHPGQLAGFLAGRHRGPVQRREGLGISVEGGAQAVAAEDLGAHAGQQLAGASVSACSMRAASACSTVRPEASRVAHWRSAG